MYTVLIYYADMGSHYALLRLKCQVLFTFSPWFMSHFLLILVFLKSQPLKCQVLVLSGPTPVAN